MFGIWAAGLVAVPINAKLHTSEFEYILSDSGARLCVISPDLAGTLAPLAGRVEALAEILDCTRPEYLRLRAGNPGSFAVAPKTTDVAWLFYTSAPPDVRAQ
jgi:long-chain acyl-CoA synthetase